MSKYLSIAVSAALISVSSLSYAQDAAYAVPDGYSAKVVEDIFKKAAMPWMRPWPLLLHWQ